MADVQETMNLLLREYPQKSIVEAKYFAPFKIQAVLRAQPNWFNLNPINKVGHFTLSEAVLGHNQMAYLLASLALQYGHFEDVKPMTLNVIDSKKFGMLISNFKIKFRSKFESTTDFNAWLRISNHRRDGLRLSLDMEFDFHEGDARGKSSGIVFLSKDQRE